MLVARIENQDERSLKIGELYIDVKSVKHAYKSMVQSKRLNLPLLSKGASLLCRCESIKGGVLVQPEVELKHPLVHLHLDLSLLVMDFLEDWFAIKDIVDYS